MSRLIEILDHIRKNTGTAKTIGLSDEIINDFSSDKTLVQAIEMAGELFKDYEANYPEIIKMNEVDAIDFLQGSLVNFYLKEAVNPYVSLAAKGPWIVTLYGAVVHDSGGYGMLGFGHDPEQITSKLDQHQVIANVMTANLSQHLLSNALFKEIGHSRSSKESLFEKFLCMNSGSESVSVAARICDINAKRMTDAGGRHEGKKIKFLGIKGGFHGRTDRPAQISDSTSKSYKKHLATFRDADNLVTVEPNNVEQLKQAFADADKNGVFFEGLFIEPVMGEGDPGREVSREFYDTARKLTRDHGTLLLVDSIQAGIRAHGCLSIVDYPNFRDAECPDMETYSKALNGAQYPLSVLALSKSTAEIYQRGVYGNTMTTNPRALDVACAVLSSVTPEMRENIEVRGKEFVDKFKALQKELPDAIERVEGTGLLFCAHLNPKIYEVVGFGSVEEWLRGHGIGVIHGGANALRYTPHFGITSKEVDLVVNKLRDVLVNGPKL